MAKTALGDFLALVKKQNIARVNRFKITFNLPAGLGAKASNRANNTDQTNAISSQFASAEDIASAINSTTDVSKTISLTCLMVDIPAVQETNTEISYGNYTRKIANGRQYSDVNTTFLVTGNYAEKTLFDQWHNLIVDESQHAVNFYDDYISSIIVECLDSQDKTVYQFTLTEAWPSAVGAIRLDRTAQNQQMVIDVNWAFHKVTYGAEPDSGSLGKLAGNGIPPVAIPGVGSGKNRLLPIPGLDSFSDAVKETVNTVKEFKGQLDGVLAVARDVREQVRDAKMQALDGVKVLQGVVKDVKAIKNIPNDVKKEVVAVVNDTKSQLGSLKGEINNFKNYPQR
jgi:hypothetical protein